MELNLFDYDEYEPTEEEIAQNEYRARLAEDEEEKKPKLIFKYKSISTAKNLVRFCDILRTKKIYMPLLENLNDPLESKNSLLLGISEKERTKFFKQYQILSLSASPLIPTMWAYYADSYKGACIGFKTNSAFSSIKKVTYHEGHEFVCGESLDEADLLKKGKAWEHEEEYRIISHDNNSDYFFFEPDDIACVILGCKMDESVRKHIKSFIPKVVPIFTVDSDPSKFSLYMKPEINPNQRVYTVDELIKKIETNT